MEFKKNQVLLFGPLILAIVLTGCETRLEPSGLKIIGQPPVNMYYDSAFAFEFGVSGGEPPYRYRYIQNPEGDEVDDDFEFNPVELTIDDTADNKPSFWLRGVPALPEGVNIETVSTLTRKYQLEVVDGNSEPKIEEYEFRLAKNRISIGSGSIRANEGSVSVQAVNTLIDARRTGNKLACKSATERLYQKSTLPSGVTVYPVTFLVTLDATTSSRVELFYTFGSLYQSGASERASVNIGFARPDVDYLDETRSVIFESGERQCLIYLNVLDDALIEGEEKLSVAFTKAEGGFISFGDARVDISIVDDEPLPSYNTESITRNEGDNVQGFFSLTSPYKHPLSINIAVDSETTSASLDDYILTPENGVVTIPAGEISASYSVSLSNNQDDVQAGVDDILTLVSDIDEIGQTDIEPFQISINEWPLDGNLNMEVVASSRDNEAAIDMDIDEEGIVSVLIEDFSASGEERTVVRGHYRDGTVFDMTGSGPIILSQPGMRIRPSAVVSESRDNDHVLVVVAEVDGQFADIQRGGSDFIVATYRRNSLGVYSSQWLKQYGSDADDFVAGAYLDTSGSIYIYGKTTGSEFDGKPGEEINNGGEDGFVYKLNIDDGEVLWTRFVGSEDQDGVISFDAGRRDAVALTSRVNTDVDAFVRNLRVQNGKDNDAAEDAIISSNKADDAKTVRFSENGSSYFVLVDGEASLPEGDDTPSRSRDISMLSFNLAGGKGRGEVLSTGQNDFAADFELLSKDGSPVVGGHTEGQFEGNQKFSPIGSTDAFISITTVNGTPKFEDGGTLQFGTPGNDKVIDIEEVSERKFMVLWSEDSTEGNGATRYRISAFSPEGEKLSPNP